MMRKFFFSSNVCLWWKSHRFFLSSKCFSSLTELLFLSFFIRVLSFKSLYCRICYAAVADFLHPMLYVWLCLCKWVKERILFFLTTVDWETRLTQETLEISMSGKKSRNFLIWNLIKTHDILESFFNLNFLLLKILRKHLYMLN